METKGTPTIHGCETEPRGILGARDTFSKWPWCHGKRGKTRGVPPPATFVSFKATRQSPVMPARPCLIWPMTSPTSSPASPPPPPPPAPCHLAGTQTPGASVLPLGLCTCSSLLSCLDIDTDVDVDVDVDVSIGIGVGVCMLPIPPSSLCSVNIFSMRFPLTTWFLPKVCSLLPLPPPPGVPDSSSRFTSLHSIDHYLIRACVFIMCLSQLPAERELHENRLVCTLRLSCPARELAKSGFSVSFC